MARAYPWVVIPKRVATGPAGGQAGRLYRRTVRLGYWTNLGGSQGHAVQLAHVSTSRPRRLLYNKGRRPGADVQALAKPCQLSGSSKRIERDHRFERDDRIAVFIRLKARRSGADG